MVKDWVYNKKRSAYKNVKKKRRLKMKQLLKKTVAFALVFAMMVTANLVMPQNTMEVQAASKVCINPYSATTVTYKTGDTSSKYSAVISIEGCKKASEIKKLKCSTKDVKLTAKNGYIKAEYGDKVTKATITCTVKNVKLKTTLTVKKYTNPYSSVKIGKTNFTSKFNTTDKYKNSKTFKKQKLVLKTKSGWIISSVTVKPGDGSSKGYSVNKNSFSKTISLKGNGGTVYTYLRNTKTGAEECLRIR